MNPNSRRFLVLLTVSCLALGVGAACGGGTALGPGNNNNVQYFPFMFQPAGESERQVDVLFVVDNSATMANEQITLQGQFAVLIQSLEAMMGGLPSLHIGTVTTDLGAGTYSTIRMCEAVGGDRGILGRADGTDLGETCIGVGQRYIADVEPGQCNVQKDPNGQCTSHDCTVANCDAVQQGAEVLDLVIDADGCPRCRNYSGALEDAFSCMAAVGTDGCGFEQHLETMYRALDRFTTPENGGFLREDAFLVVVILSDEDDCSASDTDTLFDPDPALNNINSTVGFLHSFRCFEFGVTCDQGGRDPGGRTNCVPREDSGALLHPISRYTAFLEALKDPAKLVVASIAGPFDGDVSVQWDTTDRPELVPSCTDTAGQGGVPGIRLKAFTGHFNDGTAMNDWAYTTVCGTEYTAAFQGIAATLGYRLPQAENCFPNMPAGCLAGPGGSVCRACLPQCVFFEREARGTGDEKLLELPWCGSVCGSGFCTGADLSPCTYDANNKCTCTPPLYPTVVNQFIGCAPLYYPEGMPGVRIDPDLASVIPRVEPTCVGDPCDPGTEGRASACWYMVADGTCTSGGRVGIVWTVSPGPRTWVEAECVAPSATETNCSDGVDNDEDCLTDGDDPDCSG